VQFLEHFVEKHPTSVWTPRLLIFLISTKWVDEQPGAEEEASRYALQLLLRFPEYGSVRHALLKVDVSALDGKESSQLIQSLKLVKESPYGEYNKHLADSLLNLLEKQSKE
jgi:hypothetical protein